jgi:hypothetical protein
MNYTLGEGFSPWGHGANASQLTALGVSGSNYSGDAWAAQTFVETPERRLALKETLFLKEFQDTYSQHAHDCRNPCLWPILPSHGCFVQQPFQKRAPDNSSSPEK